MYFYFYFSREPSLTRSLKCVIQTLALILAHWPSAQWLPHIISTLHWLFPGGLPFHTQQKKRTHTETPANQRREATHSRGQIQFRLPGALDPTNTRQLFSPGGVGIAWCPPEALTSKGNPNSRSKEQESSAQDK